MEFWSNIALGFSVISEPMNLVFCFLGVLLGTLIGVLPGLGPGATISLLLPLTYHLNPVASVIMVAGIYYGAKYGGSTTSILRNIPGEVTAWSPVWTVTKWLAKGERARLSELLPLAHSSPALLPHSVSCS
jgi:TctA family transporter